jgi:hypothetical protein
VYGSVKIFLESSFLTPSQVTDAVVDLLWPLELSMNGNERSICDVRGFLSKLRFLVVASGYNSFQAEEHYPAFPHLPDIEESPK